MKKKYIFISIVIVGVVALSYNFSNNYNIKVTITRDYSEQREYTISLVKLISRPENYDGKVVSVKGFISVEFEGTALYLSKADYENMIDRNAIYLSLDDLDKYKKFDQKVVRLSGVFHDGRGHMGGYSGVIYNIISIDRASSREEINEKMRRARGLERK